MSLLIVLITGGLYRVQQCRLGACPLDSNGVKNSLIIMLLMGLVILTFVRGV